LRARRPQLRDGIEQIGIEARATGVEMSEHRHAHPRIPEFPDAFDSAGNRLFAALALKQFADLIGHIDQPVKRYGRLLL
jgi:hypothetical protein